MCVRKMCLECTLLQNVKEKLEFKTWISGLIVNGVFQREAVDVAGRIDDEVDRRVQGSVIEAEKFRVHLAVNKSSHGSMKSSRECWFDF